MVFTTDHLCARYFRNNRKCDCPVTCADEEPVESVDLWWGQVLFPQTTRRVGRLWLRELRAESALWLYGATAAGRPECRAWTDGSWGTEPENHREREKYPIPFITFPRLNVDFLVEKPYFSHSLESCGFPRWIFQFKSLKNLMNYLNVPFGLSK